MRWLILAVLAARAFGADLLSTQPGVPIPANTWVKLTPPGALGYACDAVWETAYYVPALDVVVINCSFRNKGTEPNRSWIAYGLKNNQLYVLDNNSTWHNEHFLEGAHPVGGFGLDQTTSVLYGWGNFSGAQGSERYHTTYAYDFNAQVGRNLQTATNPNLNIQEPVGAFDPLRGQFVEHGGANGVGTNIYTVSSNSWAVGVTCTSNGPGCPKSDLTNPSMAYSTFEDAIYLFGGLSGGSGLQNGTFRYSPATQTWATVTISGSSPSARQAAAMAYMPDENKFLLVGGGDNETTNLHNETWVFDPVAATWTQLTPAANPSTPVAATYGRMAYIPSDGVAIQFVLASGGTEIWAYRYSAGAGAGDQGSPSYSATTGSQNRNANSWAQSTSLASDGTNLYGAWVETGTTTGGTDAEYLRPYAQQWVGATPTNLGPAYNSMSNETGASQGDDISITTVAGVPWACWHEGGNSSFVDLGIAKYWSGSAWTGGGFFGLQTAGASGYTQGPCGVLDAGGIPTFIFKERPSVTAIPSNVFAYVMQWNGSAFVRLGGYLNRTGNTSGSTNISMVDAISIAYNGSQPCAVWTEYLSSVQSNNMADSAPQTYASCWSGSSWVAQGGAANVNTSNRDYDVSAAYMGGQLYVAFTERTASGPAQVYVRTWNGSAWSTVGGATLTRDTVNGWAFRPRLITDGTNLYLSRVEQGDPTTWAFSQPSFGHRAQVFVDEWNGSTWTRLGGSVNADTSLGSASHAEIALVGGSPAALSAEVKFGSYRQVYGSQWNGTDWTALGSTPPPCSITTSSFPAATATESYSQTAAVSNCTSSTWSVTSGSLPSWASLNSSTGAISGTASGTSTATFTLSYSTATSGSLGITTNAVPSITTTTLPAGTHGSAYSQALATSGGTGTIACALTTGSLSGSSLTLNSNCTITGTAGTPATYTFTATPTDANGIAGSPSSSLSITINPSGGSAGGSALGGNAKTSGNAVIH